MSGLSDYDKWKTQEPPDNVQELEQFVEDWESDIRDIVDQQDFILARLREELETELTWEELVKWL